MHYVQATDDSLCIAVFGDFLGRETGEEPGSAEPWEPRRATPETVSGLLGLRPTVRITALQGPEPLHLQLSGLEDFHPDSLFRRLDAFQELREARQAIKEGGPLPPGLIPEEGTAPEEGTTPDDVAGEEARPEAGSPGATGEADRTEIPSGSDLLEAIVQGDAGDDEDEAGHDRPPARGPDRELRNFVREIVRPHLVSPDTERKDAIAELDRGASEMMGRILHDPGFLEMEAAWRSLVFLLSRADSAGKTRIYLVPVTKTELARELLSRDEPHATRLFDLLSTPPPGVPDGRWGLALGAYHFGPGPEELEVLRGISRVAGRARVPWLSGMSPRVMGVDSFSASERGEAWPDEEPEEWRSLRREPEAAWLGLVAPRFLVREPYGPGGLRAKAFQFQEPVASRSHLPWGNGAFVCGALLAQAHARAGWRFRPSQGLDMDGLPLTPGAGGDDPRPSPLEAELSTGAARMLAERGVVPLVSFPGQARIRAGGLRSLQEDGSELRGRWEEGR